MNIKFGSNFYFLFHIQNTIFLKRKEQHERASYFKHL
jgi:hypothetical protein